MSFRVKKKGDFFLLAVLADCCFICRGLTPPDAEMLYMQEVERMEGYGEETYPAKVNDILIFVSWPFSPCLEWLLPAKSK